MPQERRPVYVRGRGWVPGPPVLPTWAKAQRPMVPVSSHEPEREMPDDPASFAQRLNDFYQSTAETVSNVKDAVNVAARLGAAVAESELGRNIETVRNLAGGTRDLAQRAYQGASEFAQQAGDELRQLTPEAAVSSLDALGSGFTGGERATPDRGSRLEQLGMGLGIVGNILDPSPGGEARAAKSAAKAVRKPALELLADLKKKMDPERLDQLLWDWDEAFFDPSGTYLKRELSDRFSETGNRARPMASAQKFLDWVSGKSANPSWMDDPKQLTPADRDAILAARDEAAQILGFKSSPPTTSASAPAVVTQRAMPEPLGSLAATLEQTPASRVADEGPYRLKDSVVGRLSEGYRAGAASPSQSNWEGVSDELIDSFGGDREAAHMWSRLWGATSPNTSVPRNTAESVSALLHLLDKGDFITVEAARKLNPKITMAPSKVPNINNAYAGLPLSGDKVEAMAGFMVGEPRSPIDVHYLYGLGSKNTKLDAEMKALRTLMTDIERLPLKGSLTNTDIYLRYERALRNALSQIAPGPITPARTNQIFATTWEGFRDLKGLKPQGGPVDILRAKGLLKAGAMLDPDQLEKALRSKGWAVGAIAALLAGINEESGQ